MKKIYVTPMTDTIEVRMDSLLVQYSNGQAAVGATTLSRESGSWDDEE